MLFSWITFVITLRLAAGEEPFKETDEIQTSARGAKGLKKKK
jgi:hypothetical protein